jgi:acetylornithine deacetylase
MRGMPYGCDLGLLTRVGEIPGVVFGPGDIRDAHRPNESVGVDDLVACARAITEAIVRTCRTPEHT